MPINADMLASFDRWELYQALIVDAHGYDEAMRIFTVACLDREVPTVIQKDLLLDVHRNHTR